MIIKGKHIPHTDLLATDYVLHEAAFEPLSRNDRLPAHAQKPVHLGDDVYLGPVKHQLAFRRACEMRGERVLRPYYLAPVHYGMYRVKAPAPDDRHAFDSDLRLRTAIMLSRLIRPTTLSYAYAVRVIHKRGARREVIPFDYRGPGASAFILGPPRDNFLRDEDVAALRTLIAQFRPAQLPRRVKRALWNHEFSSWMEQIEIRLPLLVTGLESLVHTDERGRKGMKSTEQFVSRLLKLGSCVPGVRWTKAQLLDAYEHRSRLVHGQGDGRAALSRRGRAVVSSLEHGFRLVLQRCISHRAVADIFRSDRSIRLHLGF